ncbi:MAG TPA: tetratricopeptide repeat protein [Puia sp.]|jgi:Tfp pilus assembly protein PilF|nr:tetratricopeptide repeat protein [Puia sp.]
MDRIERLKEFLQSDPNDAFSKHALALEYVKLGDDAAARRLFEEILQRDPAYVGSYYQLGRLLERTGEKDLAIQWLEKGMAAAKAADERRTYNELRSAYDELQD